MKKTAVEWLVENYLPLKRGVELKNENTLKKVKQAIEMENEHNEKLLNEINQIKILINNLENTNNLQCTNWDTMNENLVKIKDLQDKIKEIKNNI